METGLGDSLSRLYGRRLRAVRVEVGLRQIDVAAELGITPGGYSSVERGRARMFVTDIPRYAAALHVEPAYLARRLGLCDEGADIAQALVERFGPDLGAVLVRLDAVLALMEHGDTTALAVTMRRLVEPYEHRDRL